MNRNFPGKFADKFKRFGYPVGHNPARTTELLTMANRHKNYGEDQPEWITSGKLPTLFDRSILYWKRHMRSGELIEGAHYVRTPGDGPSAPILWNKALITDWLINGGCDSPAHMRAVQKFLSQLPSNNIA